ncbi:hypothetical protein DL771_008205 [Monosporascus sp. 5C6A]|nr:hypothetical protein DL771_008205 [Monosporascus sp. 5C6A]
MPSERPISWLRRPFRQRSRPSEPEKDAGDGPVRQAQPSYAPAIGESRRDPASRPDQTFTPPSPSPPLPAASTVPSTDVYCYADTIDSAASLSEHLWNRAYYDLKLNETALVEAYEKILSRKLRGDRFGSRIDESEQNEIVQDDVRARRCQLYQLISAGLDKTAREARVKEGAGEAMEVFLSTKNLISTAVHAMPQAALAWTGVCIVLEVSLSGKPDTLHADFREMFANPIAETEANRKGIEYVIKRMEWYWNLSGPLLRQYTVGDNNLSGVRHELEARIIDLYRALLLYQIKSVCSYYRNRGLVLLRDIAKLDDWDGKVDTIRHAEDVFDRDSNAFTGQKMRSHLEQLVSHQMTEKDQQCVKALRLTDPRHDKTRIERTKGGLLHDSYRWILDNPDFQRWRDHPESRLLWIKGDPGKGKTMLLCGIVDELKSTPPALLSFFFCQGTDLRINNASAVLRGLIYLVVDQQPSLISHVRREYDRAGETLFEDVNAWDAMLKIFTSILQDPSLKTVFLIIDALDECVTNLPELLDFIVQSSSLRNVKWLLSSRNKSGIERQLRLDDARTRLSLELKENAKQISSAVDIYIDDKLSRLESVQDDEMLRDQVRNILHMKANGTFLWVALVVQELEKAESWEVLQVVEEVPPGLNELYRHMVDQIQRLQKRNPEFCRLILSAASVAYRPLHLAEIAVLSGIPNQISAKMENVGRIIAMCGSFLTVRDDRVYLVHQSAKDFLSRQASSIVFPSSVTAVHYTMYSRSLHTMRETLRRDMYGLSAPGFPIDNVQVPDPDPLATARYACVYWVDHLWDSLSGKSTARDGLHGGDTVYTFIKEKYLYWLEALSLLRGMPEGVLAVEKLENLVTLEGHSDWVVSVAFSADSQQLASASADETVKIWDTTTGKCLQTLKGHGGRVHSVAFSTNSQRLASASDDKAIKIWDITAGKCIQTFEGHKDRVYSVIFSVDNQQLVSASVDKTVKIWNIATGKCLQTLKGHGGPVWSVAFSADNQQLASASDDGTVKIWDIAIGKCLQTLESHSRRVQSVAFSTDGQQLASASDDETIKIWNAAAGKYIRTLDGYGGPIWSIAFSANNQQLASASDNGTIGIWDTVTGECLQMFKGHGGRVYSVAFSANNQQLASASDDKTIKIWDTGTNKYVQTLEGHNDTVQSVAFSADGQQFASASNDRTVKIWDTATGKYLQTFKGHNDTVRSIAYSADNQHLASASDDKTVKIWNTFTGKCLQTFKGHNGRVFSVTFSADNQRLALALDDGTVRIWDMATGICFQTFEGHGRVIHSVAFSASDQQLASISNNTIIKIWDITTGKYVQTLQGHNDTVWSIVFSADKQQLASASDDSTIKIWDIATGKCVQAFDTFNDQVILVTFSADGQRLISASHNGIIKIWDITTKKCLQKFESHGSPVDLVAFSADNQQLISASVGETVKIWNTATGKCIQKLEGHGSPVRSVASADGRRLASALDNKAIKIWDITTGKCIQTFEGHNDQVYSVTFSVDNQQFASASVDKTVKIWDTATGKCLQTFKGDSDTVQLVAFSADSQRLASASDDGTVKIWDTATGNCIQKLEGHGSPVRSVASADGRRLASASNNSIIKIWDTAARKCVQTFEGHGGWVRSVAFSANGQQLASASNNGTVKVWDAARGECQQTINTGTSLANLSFHHSGSYLLTEVGRIEIEPPSRVQAATPDATNTPATTAAAASVGCPAPERQDPKRYGYGLSPDRSWITRNGQNVLWLPPDYRAQCAAVLGRMVCVGSRGGRVLFFCFSSDS